MSQRRGVDDGGGLTSVDLLEEIRAALDGLEPLLLGRMVDIEMPRLRVLTDPRLCRRLLAELVGYAVAHSEPPDSIAVRVARAGKAARIEVFSEGGHATGDDLPRTRRIPGAAGGLAFVREVATRRTPAGPRSTRD